MSDPLLPHTGARFAPGYAEMTERRQRRHKRREIRVKAEALGLEIIDGQVTTDVHCPNDNELTDLQCWKCGWLRDPAERTETKDKAKKAGLVPAWTM